MDVKEHPTTRFATLYDAVAGRVNVTGFIREPTSPDDTEAHASSIQIPPDEVLFRRKGAPIRYAENDIYDAHRSLPTDQKLPDSDLLKAIHEYTAHFYQRATLDRGRLDYGSLDETALIAMGILLEEASAEALGITGDLALVEPPEPSEGFTKQENQEIHLSTGNKRRRLVTHTSSRSSVKREGASRNRDTAVRLKHEAT